MRKYAEAKQAAIAALAAHPVPKFAVILEGGLVQCVVSNDPALIGVQFAVIDYDTEGADDDEISRIPQGGAHTGELADACYRVDEITKADIDYENPEPNEPVGGEEG